MTTPHSADALKQRAFELYKPPFRYESGYIYDANGHMVADDAEGAPARVRGWGRISYMPDAEALQDTVGELIADALTAAWNRRPTPASDLCADLNAERINLNAGAKESTFIDIGALRGKLASMDENGFGSIRFTLGEARALLDRVERAEAAFSGFANSESPDRDAESGVAAAGAVPEGYVLVPIHATNAITCAIERQIDSQLTASGMDANAMFRQDGGYVWDAAIAAATAAAPKASPSQQAEAAPVDPNITEAEARAALAAMPPEQLASMVRGAPAHETIVTEGDTLVCTACGTTAPAAAPETCQCPDCLTTGLHASGCAVHNAPAYPNGPCDCRAPAAAPSEPVAWIRFCSDGTYEGPIMDCAIEDVRKKSGAWTPLFAAPPAQDAGRGDAKEVAEAVAREVIDHIDTMYPAMWSAVAKTARTSIRNTIINQSGRFIRAIANSGRTE